MTFDLLITLLSWLCFITGGFFLFIGSLGMVRLEDFWARLHAASIIDSAGAGLILFGVMVQTGLTLITVKIVIIIIFLLITGPTASHAVANAAFISGSRPKDLVEDATAPLENNPQSNTVKKTAVKQARKRASDTNATKKAASSKKTQAKSPSKSPAKSSAKPTRKPRTKKGS